VSLPRTVSVTGLSAAGSVGTITITQSANVFVTGISATGSVGPVLVWGNIVPNQNPSWGNIAPNQNPSWIEIAA
jgi:hypothetical protein